MKRKVTIADIAVQIGISTATVSRALKNSPSISESVKEKVWEQARAMGYGRTPALEDPKSIVVIVPELLNFFYTEIIHNIEQTIADQSYLLSVYCSYNSFEKEISIINNLNLSDVCCFIVSKAMDSPDSKHLKQIVEKGIPLISFNRVDFEIEGPKFVIDNYMDAYGATKKLLDAGYKRVAFAAKHYNCPIYQEREQAYRDVLKERNIPFDPSLLLYSELTQADISEVINHFLSMTPRADALLLPNYYAAIQAIYLARIKNITIPNELGIFSFDEEIYSKLNIPSISSIERPLQKIGTEIGSLVNKIIEKRRYENDKITVYTSTLITRGSTLVSLSK